MRYVCLLVALASLGGCSKAPVGSGSTESFHLASVAVDVPERPTEADIPKLLDLMVDPDPPTRHQAALALAKIDDPALPRLLDCLKSEHALAREMAANNADSTDWRGSDPRRSAESARSAWNSF